MNQTHPALIHDGMITVAVGKSRKETDWKNREMLWSQLVKRFSQTHRSRETAAEYHSMKKEEQDGIKDVGGFVGGSLKGGRRKAENVAWRQLVTLDADFSKGNLWAGVEAMLGCGCVLYSTHSHTPDKPRLRLVIPLSRPVSPDEYQAVARRIAADVGIDFFDDSTYESARLMYWPSTPADGEFVFRHLDEPWINSDEVLARYPDWQDASYWPESSRIRQRRQKMAEKQGDPREKKGIVGAFCRTYDIPQAIEAFLGDAYTPSSDPNRYTYTKGTSSAGLVLYGEGAFAYSHHGTDPVGGRLCNAFDLVRLHRFGLMDEDARDDTPVNRLPSYKAMQELAMRDPAVRHQVAADGLLEAGKDFDDSRWMEGLEITARGEIRESVSNLVLILRHDDALRHIGFNEHYHGFDVRGQVPWIRIKEGWSKGDEASLACYIEQHYRIWSPGKSRDALMAIALERSFHPVREYLEALPPWDGSERVEKLLIHYLGADDSLYVRAVTRKTLCAAVARVYQPGIKFDTMLVLGGPQGIGKSTLFARLAGKWYSDSLSLYDMRDKTAAEKLQGCWVMEVGELAGMRKMDLDKVKAFISSTNDRYRPSYGTNVENHPRQCVLVASTNNDTGFLRDITGNRRFWPVWVPGSTGGLKPWQLTEVDQIWAEAKAQWQKGETLYLPPELEKEAMAAQTDAMESDDREGLIKEYLEVLLPMNWYEMSPYERRSFIRGDEIGGMVAGNIPRERVCTLEIWFELFGKETTSLRKQDAYDINAMMRKMDGWEKYTGNKRGNARVPGYGVQRVYVRCSQ
ncbi:MAG: virulence-associated E family protein [Bacillota bacterium]|nr:virulence-associated E family protein [Bacillota bacterium]MDW7677841.1 virulence-associated E family protein [Bacillota bacterium]